VAPAQVSWASWSIDPVVLLGIAAVGFGYLWAIGPGLKHFPRATAVGFGKPFLFFSGLVILFVTVSSPLHVLGDEYLLTAHMIQHLLLMLVVAPLILAGIPSWLGERLLFHPRLAQVVRWMTRPVPAFIIFNGIFAAWHIPWLYQSALGNDMIHRTEHATMLFAAFVGWMPLISPFPQAPSQPYPVSMVFTFLNVFPSQIIGALLSLGDGVAYPVYALAPRVWGWQPMFDQQVAGLIMWVGEGFYFFGVITVLFFLWSAKQEREDRAARLARARARRPAAPAQPNL
jgi:putative membrane protein